MVVRTSVIQEFTEFVHVVHALRGKIEIIVILRPRFSQVKKRLHITRASSDNDAQKISTNADDPIERGDPKSSNPLTGRDDKFSGKNNADANKTCLKVFLESFVNNFGQFKLHSGPKIIQKNIVLHKSYFITDLINKK